MEQPAEASQFAKAGYTVVEGFLPDEVRQLLARYYEEEIRAGRFEYGDPRVRTRYYCYQDAVGRILLDQLRERVEAATGLEVIPTYSFALSYEPGSILPRHRDRDACEISVSVTVENEPDEIWPLGFEINGRDVEIRLRPGDAIVYRGTELPHFRKELPQGRRNRTLLLHYVARGGTFEGQVERERRMARIYSSLWYRLLVRSILALHLEKPATRLFRR